MTHGVAFGQAPHRAVIPSERSESRNLVVRPRRGTAVDTLAFWMPGPWELLICLVLALVLIGGVGVIAALVIVIARSSSRQPPEPTPEDEAAPPGLPPPDAGASP